MCPRVSIIVAIYNADLTLSRCIDSLLSQTFVDFEILLVDDGSTDSSYKICGDYAIKDCRIKVLHKANGGVSSARQYGIDHAIGLYTIHIDPDDWVEPDMLESLCKKADETNSDMIVCDFLKDCYKGQEYIRQTPSSLEHNRLLKDFFVNKLHGSLCNKLIKRECYIKYNIHFPTDIDFCEDLYVVASLLKNEIKVSYLPQAYYHYCLPLNMASLSRNYTSETFQKDERLRDSFQKLFEKTDLYEEVTLKFHYMIVVKAFYYGRNFYTSSDFREHFKSYLPYILKAKGGKIEKGLLILSSIGLYRPISFFLQKILKLKHYLIKNDT
jgi:capsular polysaccharide biosynthesis protein cpsI